MIEDIDNRAKLILSAVEGLSTFEAIGFLMAVIGYMTAPKND